MTRTRGCDGNDSWAAMAIAFGILTLFLLYPYLFKGITDTVLHFPHAAASSYNGCRLTLKCDLEFREVHNDTQ